MTINFQYVGMPVSESLNTIMSKKLDKLGEKFEWIIKADVFFKQENDPTGKGKICEILLSAPGPRLFAKSTEDNFEKAGAATVKELEIQCKKRKEVFKRY